MFLNIECLLGFIDCLGLRGRVVEKCGESKDCQFIFMFLGKMFLLMILINEENRYMGRVLGEEGKFYVY